MRIVACMDDVNLHLVELTEKAMPVAPDLIDEPLAVGIIVDKGKSQALPLPGGHEVTAAEKRLLDEAGLPVAEEGITEVGVSIRTDA